jgi:hypothetical protein
MKHFKGIILLLLMACIALAMAASIFAGVADARADFEKWSNRSARIVEPADYKTNGTCTEAICTWKGVGGVGNLGIGDGNVSLMKPEVISGMAEYDTQAAGSNESSGETAGKTANETASAENATADGVIRAPAGNPAGNGTLVSRNVDTQPAVPEGEAEGPITESLFPDYDLAASVIPRGVPYSLTVNTPFEHILSENPTEASVLYGKLIGFPMPGGQVVDIGIKCIGYEY